MSVTRKKKQFNAQTPKRHRNERLPCLKRVKSRPIRWMDLRGVCPRTHIGENHNSFTKRTIQNLSVSPPFF